MSTAARFHHPLWIAFTLDVLTIPVAAYAHTDAVTGQDYSGFERNDGRGSCCDWHDCRPAREPFMEPDGEKIIDMGNNKFFFDPGKVVKRPSDDGNWHVCASARTLNCIIAPPQAMRGPDLLDPLLGRIVTAHHPANQTPLRTVAKRADAPACTVPGL